MVMPTKYKRDIHIKMLKDIYSKGGDIAHFCREAGIARDTFQMWRKTHPEFHEAYKIALEVARAHWEDIGANSLYDANFNQNAWCRIMLNRFEMTQSRKVAIKGLSTADSYKAKFQCVEGELEEGNLTPEEAHKLAQFISVGAKIEEIDELKVRVSNLEGKLCHSQAV